MKRFFVFILISIFIVGCKNNAGSKQVEGEDTLFSGDTIVHEIGNKENTDVESVERSVFNQQQAVAILRASRKQIEVIRSKLNDSLRTEHLQTATKTLFLQPIQDLDSSLVLIDAKPEYLDPRKLAAYGDKFAAIKRHLNAPAPGPDSIVTRLYKLTFYFKAASVYLHANAVRAQKK